MTRFFHAHELRRPEDVQQYLADPTKHWRPLYSAFELATSWIASKGIPARVREVLDQSNDYCECELVEGLFEREVDLRTPGFPSKTDLLALVRLAKGGYAVIAVEGKVDETFGPVVAEWNTTAGTARRLESLCHVLALDPEAASPLRYQLIHRSVSALYEAERYGTPEAMMLVHSFSQADASFSDYSAFAKSLGLGGAEVDQVSDATSIGGRRFRVGWVRDTASAAL
jgi:hypothetical protein